MTDFYDDDYDIEDEYDEDDEEDEEAGDDTDDSGTGKVCPKILNPVDPVYFATIPFCTLAPERFVLIVGSCRIKSCVSGSLRYLFVLIGGPG